MDVDKNKRFSFENTSGRVFSALFLISLGIVFLLNTSGVVSWSVWGGFALLFVKIWPVFLILVGLQIILGKSFLSHLFFSFVWFLIFAAGIFIGIVNYSQETPFTKELRSQFGWLINLDLSSQEGKTNSTFITKETEYNSQEVTINLKSGELAITDDEDIAGVQIESTFYNNYGEPKITEVVNNNIQKVDFEQYFQQGLLKLSANLNYNMEIGDAEKLLNMELNLTAGSATLEFEEKAVENLSLNMVAGSADLEFSNKSLPLLLDISLTAGSVKIELPDDTGLIVSNSSIAGSTTIFGEVLKANETKTFNKDSVKKVIININQTAGSLTVN